MRAKRLRRWVSCTAIAAVAFAQVAIAFHACPVRASGPVAATQVAASDEREQCADMGAAPAAAPGNACEAHCNTAVVPSPQLDLPAAALVALPAPAITVAASRSSDVSPGAIPLAVSRAPPLTLQFCRLLI